VEQKTKFILEKGHQPIEKNYAKRKNMPVDVAESWLSPNLNYDV
jgi:hypothetical protein